MRTLRPLRKHPRNFVEHLIQKQFAGAANSKAAKQLASQLVAALEF